MKVIKNLNVVVVLLSVLIVGIFLSTSAFGQNNESYDTYSREMRPFDFAVKYY